MGQAVTRGARGASGLQNARCSLTGAPGRRYPSWDTNPSRGGCLSGLARQGETPPLPDVLKGYFGEHVYA
jgi:hypothetical protein